MASVYTHIRRYGDKNREVNVSKKIQFQVSFIDSEPVDHSQDEWIWV